MQLTMPPMATTPSLLPLITTIKAMFSNSPMTLIQLDPSEIRESDTVKFSTKTTKLNLIEAGLLPFFTRIKDASSKSAKELNHTENGLLRFFAAIKAASNSTSLGTSPSTFFEKVEAIYSNSSAKFMDIDSDGTNHFLFFETVNARELKSSFASAYINPDQVCMLSFITTVKDMFLSTPMDGICEALQLPFFITMRFPVLPRMPFVSPLVHFPLFPEITLRDFLTGSFQKDPLIIPGLLLPSFAYQSSELLELGIDSVDREFTTENCSNARDSAPSTSKFVKELAPISEVLDEEMADDGDSGVILAPITPPKAAEFLARFSPTPLEPAYNTSTTADLLLGLATPSLPSSPPPSPAATFLEAALGDKEGEVEGEREGEDWLSTWKSPQSIQPPPGLSHVAPLPSPPPSPPPKLTPRPPPSPSRYIVEYDPPILPVSNTVPGSYRPRVCSWLGPNPCPRRRYSHDQYPDSSAYINRVSKKPLLLLSGVKVFELKNRVMRKAENDSRGAVEKWGGGTKEIWKLSMGKSIMAHGER